MATLPLHRTRLMAFIAGLAMIIGVPDARADWKKLLEKVPGNSTSGTSGLGGGLSQNEIAGGLRDALAQGVRRAVSALGKRDGFLGNPDVKIPLPGALSKVESALRMVGQSRYADEFVETMNRAAERAVPEATSIFADSISKVTLDDAKKILDGPDDAATRYFQRTSTETLVERFRPIVATATDRAGVTSAFKRLIDNAGFVGQLAGKNLADVDGYVTDQAVAGLFKLIAAEEKRIRTQPVARATALLKKVFR